MTSLTIKNIPEEIYIRLKESATVNRRSINSEVITILDSALQSGPIDPDAWLPAVRRLREKSAGYFVTEEELDEAKRSGRP
jgi:plasmid stability protein